MGSLPGVSGAVKKEEEDVEEDDILGVQLLGGNLLFGLWGKGEVTGPKMRMQPRGVCSKTWQQSLYA